jgi:hypothetical protein
MFTVRWTRAALDRLAAIWLRVPSAQRRALTAATHAIDGRLSNDPLNEGESRPAGRRVLLVPPLGVAFRANAQARTVIVLQAWYIRPPQSRP